MRYIVLAGPIPRLKQVALDRRIAKINTLPSVSDKKAYIKKTNTWGLLKKWLAGLSYGKCWYCEACSERAVADVDHFRPKAGVTCNRTTLSNHDGYYWLAYDWLNYRYSCQRCNRPEEDENNILRGKANEFALVDEKLRNNGPTCSNNEEPLLLDPCKLSDTKLMAHLISGTVEASHPKGSVEFERAIYTRDLLGLNSFKVPQKKRDGWGPLDLLIQLVGENPQVESELVKKLDPSAEYSSFYRAAISSHRDKAWVEALL